LFIGILKGIAFEWFMKIPEGSIKNWGDLEKIWRSYSSLVSSKMIQRLSCQLS